MAHSKTFLFLLVLFISCSLAYKTNDTKPQTNIPLADTSKTVNPVNEFDKEFEAAWTTFANAILSGDLKKVKELSSNCIRCSDCVTNTPREDSLYNKFKNKNPDTWYDKLSSELSFIPIDQFIKEDLALLFDPVLKSRMFDTSKIGFHNDEINKKLYDKKCIISSANLKNSKLQEAVVLVIDPSVETEGLQKAFAFIQTKQGYKFCGYSTIP
jgi:hypothetical protein